MKKILFLTFSYAPYNVTGTFRAMRFIKYLPKYGIKPIVVTADQGKHHWNEKLYTEVPDEAEVIRLKSFFQDSQARQNSSQFYKVTSNKKFSKLSVILKFLKDFFFSPDVQITWCIRWFLKIVKLIRKYEVKSIIITGAPFSLFVLGAILKKITNIKVVLDYRDSWLDDTSQKNQSIIRQLHNKWMEKFVIQNIDYLLTTTSTIKRNIKNKYCFDNVRVVYNGFDPEDYKDLKIEKSDNQVFRLVYAGKFNVLDVAYNPRNILLGIKKLLDEDNDLDIELIVCGKINKATQDWIKRNKIDFINLKGFISRDVLIQIENKADAFLHFYYPKKIRDTISIKTFEYAQFNKPIISVNTGDSEVSNFLNDTKLGISCENDSIDDIVEKLKELTLIDLNLFQNNIVLDEIEKYNQVNLTKQVAEIIHKLEQNDE